MRLSVKAFSLAVSLLWAGCVLFTAVLNLIWPAYGGAFLDMVRSIYPGYAAMTGISAVIVGTLYALIDGAICGALLAWLYNWFAAEAVAERGAAADVGQPPA